MIDLTKRLDFTEYLDSFQNIAENAEDTTQEEKIEVSKAISSISLWYEKVRNVIDYRDEHLIRRFAIERELKRLFKQEDPKKSAEKIVKTLIRGKYLPNSSVPMSKVNKLEAILQKYNILRSNSASAFAITPKLDDVSEYIVEIASSEIEKLLVPSYVPEITAVYFASVFEPNIQFLDGDDTYKWPVLVSSAHRAIHNLDISSIKYYTFCLLHPDWEQMDESMVSEIDIDKTINDIDFVLNNPAFDKCLLLFRKHSPTFRTLENVLLENLANIEPLREEETLLRKTQIFLKKAYENSTAKVNRRVTRSIIYIFITKMVLAVILEIPIDRYLEGKINILSLAINIVMPPLILFLIAVMIRKPGDEDLNKLLKLIKTLKDQNPLLSLDKKIRVTFKQHKMSVLDYGFNVFYGLVTLLIIWFSYTVLTAIGYNLPSYIIFLFFLSVVSYFGYTIASAASEYKVVTLNEGGFLTFLSDSLTLPIIRVGRSLSQGVSKLNLFVFILDFIIESPFKLLVEFLEEWLSFVREKREETVA